MTSVESEHIFRLENARTEEVLRVEIVQGEGTQKIPCRRVWRFYLPNGRYIGELLPDDVSR